MAKLLLVEDDNNLREIYEARLQAEGYTIVSAKDGEEALVVAKAEKPDLVISDVMMPKISGFEMLDILRNTDELKGVKVIMLTALGQSDDQQRADKLGADRYLVKSQVTLEDIVKVTHELLEGDSAPTPAPTTDDTAISASDSTASEPVDTPVAEPPAEPSTTAVPTPEPEEPAPEPVAAPVDPVEPKEEPTPEPEPEAPKPEPDSEAADKAAEPTEKEEADVEAKIEDFVAGASSEPTAPEGGDSLALASEPTTTTPATPPDNTTTPADDKADENTSSDDKLMADAVEELVASTDKGKDDSVTEIVTGAEAPSAPEAPEPKSIPVSVAPDDDAAKPDATTSDNDTAADTGAGAVAHKKVIKPLENGEAKKDINELLAEEEAKAPQSDLTPGSVVTSGGTPAETEADSEDRPSGQPASAPGSVTAPAAKDGGVDPNSIAL